MRFQDPIFLLLIFLPLLFLSRRLRWNKSKKKINQNNIPFSTALKITDIKPSLRQRIRRPILLSLSFISFLFLVIAIARPQSGSAFTETESSGRDILLALDTSGSMETPDYVIDGKRVDRLTALKSVVKEFIDTRIGDRLGLVVFGSEAFTQCPLTLDTLAIKQFIDALSIGMAGKGTAIGDALAVSLKRIIEIKGESKVLVLVTDGFSTTGRLTPEQGANLAKELGVKIHTIGIGSNKRIGGVLSRLTRTSPEFDEVTLKKISQITGGKYFHAEDTEGLKSVYQEIDKLEERIEKTMEHIEYDEHYTFFALFGLILFFISEFLAGTILLKIP